MTQWLLPEEHRAFEQSVRDMVEPINAELAKLEADFIWKRDYYDNHGELDSSQFQAIAERFSEHRYDLVRQREMAIAPLAKMLALLPPRPTIVLKQEPSPAFPQEPHALRRSLAGPHAEARIRRDADGKQTRACTIARRSVFGSP